MQNMIAKVEFVKVETIQLNVVAMPRDSATFLDFNVGVARFVPMRPRIAFDVVVKSVIVVILIVGRGVVVGGVIPVRVVPIVVENRALEGIATLMLLLMWNTHGVNVVL